MGPLDVGRLMIGRALAAGVVLLALAVPSPASSASSSSCSDARIAAAASYVAGRPVRVACTVDPVAWGLEVDGRALGYWDPADPDVVHVGPYATEALRDPSSPLFGGGLHVLAHEAAHARGVWSERAASVWGTLLPMELARRFYGVGFFTPASRAIEAASLSILLLTPPEYRPTEGGSDL